MQLSQHGALQYMNRQWGFLAATVFTVEFTMSSYTLASTLLDSKAVLLHFHKFPFHVLLARGSSPLITYFNLHRGHGEIAILEGVGKT